MATHFRINPLYVSTCLLGCLVASPAQSRAQAPAAAVAHEARSLEGAWQGTLNAPQRSLRIVLKVVKADKGWAATMYSIDQPSPGFKAVVTLDGNAFKASVDMIGGTFEGTLSPDGNTLNGTWTQGPQPIPLTMVRATKETAWEIPAPPPPPKLMAADADPSFEVATIKPNDSGATSMQGLNVGGRNFRTRASSLADLISFSYQLQIKQIVNLPDWATKDRYDIDATIQPEGAPNPAQVRTMIQKLLADRFALKFHKEKREMSAYVMTIGKDGKKFAATEMKGPLPGIGMRPTPSGLAFMIRNADMGEFTAFLQVLVLDRPVVDRTGLTDHYDLTFTFTPDDSLFNGHPPPLPAKTDSTEAAPNFFEALTKSTGLKLDAQKAPVDVLAVDHAQKPSAN